MSEEFGCQFHQREALDNRAGIDEDGWADTTREYRSGSSKELHIQYAPTASMGNNYK